MAEANQQFVDFLKDTVNLNQTRIDTLDGNSTAIQNFIEASDWAPKIVGFEHQGSWAHDTIIKPVEGGEFDADLLVVVEPVDGWEAEEYIKSLYKVFRGNGTYKAKVKAWDYCVTITYAGDQQVDVAPLIKGRLNQGSYEVCNKKTNDFIPSEPMQYTRWLIDQNNLSGSNSFRKVTRLLKYLRDIKTRFVCSSVLLTTLLGHQVKANDKGSAAFANTPRTLQTLVGRMDDWLQANEVKPKICNPFLPDEDFAEIWTDTQYKSFRNCIHRYRGWIDEAIAAEQGDATIRAWRKLFSEDFAPNIVLKAARADGRFALADPFSTLTEGVHNLIDWVKIYGRKAIPRNFRHAPHMRTPVWEQRIDPDLDIIVTATIGEPFKATGSRSVASAEVLNKKQSVYFQAERADGQPISTDYRVHWRITNTGDAPELRGDFYASSEHGSRSERLLYPGVHMAEAFLVRKADNALVAVSDPFYVAIDR